MIVYIVVYVHVYVCPLHRSSTLFKLPVCTGPSTAIRTGARATEAATFEKGAMLEKEEGKGGRGRRCRAKREGMKVHDTCYAT